MTLSKVLMEDNLTLLKYTISIVAAYSSFNFASKEKFFMKKKEPNENEPPFVKKLKKHFKEESIPHFKFLFLSLASINLIMRIGMKLNPNFKKFGFLVGFFCSYYFVKKFNISFPLSLSFYVLA